MPICTCTERCNGSKSVSTRTWRDHRQFRNKIETYEEYLAQRGRVGTAAADAPNPPDAPAPPGPKKLIFPPRRTRKRRRIAADVSGDEGDDRATRDSGQASGSDTQNSPLEDDAGLNPMPMDDLPDPPRALSEPRENGIDQGGPPDQGPVPPPPDAHPPPAQSRILPVEAEEEELRVTRDDIMKTYEYIELIKNATLEGSGLTPSQLHRLRNPPEKPFDIQDKDTLLSIKLFMACGNASQETYNAVVDAIKEHSPDIEVLSLAQVNTVLDKFTGVIEVHDESNPPGSRAASTCYLLVFTLTAQDKTV